MTLPRFYTIKEAAAAMTLSKSKVYELVDHLKIRSYRLAGGAVRIAEADLLDYIKTSRVDTIEDRKRVDRMHRRPQ